jgi:hypothetical protein
MCRLDSKTAYCKASKKTQIKHKYSNNAQKYIKQKKQYGNKSTKGKALKPKKS